MTSQNLIDDFSESMLEAESILASLGFAPHSFRAVGYAQFRQFKKGNMVVEFMFGPSEWQVEMLIETDDQTYALKDLLKIPLLQTWVTENKYIPPDRRNVRLEVLWFLDLVKVAVETIP